MMHYNCLIVDDEMELAKMTCEYFQMFDVSAAFVESGEACLAFLANNTVDLMLLDINLGDGSGFEICKRVRESLQIPILFISARQSDDDILVALSIGGDDYVKKPYSLSVLLAKVKVTLRRLEQNRLDQTAVDASREGHSAGMGDVTSENQFRNMQTTDIRLEQQTMSVYRREEKIPLKAKEFALLKCLYDRRGTIVTKDELFEQVWGDSFYSDGTLNVHIRKLREKLEEDPNHPTLIKTIWGTGYMLQAEEP